MHYDVITILDTCVDLVVDLGDTIPEFDQKEKWVDSFSVEMGGSSCIFACQAAKLGLKTVGVGVVGCDAFGQIVLDGLASANVDISYIRKDESLKTGLGVLLTRGDDRAILTYSGTIGAVKPEFLTDELLGKARHLHVASYYLLTGVLKSFPDILRRAKALGLTVSLDTNWDPSEKWELPDVLLQYVDIFIPNENEAMFLTRTNEVTKAASLLAQKVPLVVVKQGAEGAMVMTGEKHVNHQSKFPASKGGVGGGSNVLTLPPMEVKVVDTVGAGDSFAAGFIYAYLSEMELCDCLRAGLYCGSMNTTQTGGTSGQARLEDLSKFLNS